MPGVRTGFTRTVSGVRQRYLVNRCASQVCHSLQRAVMWCCFDVEQVAHEDVQVDLSAKVIKRGFKLFRNIKKLYIDSLKTALAITRSYVWTGSEEEGAHAL